MGYQLEYLLEWVHIRLPGLTYCTCSVKNLFGILSYRV